MPLATPNLPPPAQFRATERPTEPAVRAPAAPKSKAASREARTGSESFAGALRRSNDRDRAVSPERDAQKAPETVAPARGDGTDNARAESDSGPRLDAATDRADARPEEPAGAGQNDGVDARSEPTREPSPGAEQTVQEAAAEGTGAESVANTTQPIVVVLGATTRLTAELADVTEGESAGVSAEPARAAPSSPTAAPLTTNAERAVQARAEAQRGSDATNDQPTRDAEASKALAGAPLVEQPDGEGERPTSRVQAPRRGGARGLERLLERAGGVAEDHRAAPATSGPTGDAHAEVVHASGAAVGATAAQSIQARDRQAGHERFDVEQERGASVNAPGAARAEPRKRAGSTEGVKAGGAEHAPATGPGAQDASRAAALGLGGPERAQKLGVTTAAPGGAQPVTSGSGDEAEALRATVSRGLSAAVSQKGGTITLRLEPESLGALRIQLDIVGGVVNARFEASSEQTAELLSRSIDSLRASLESKGLGVDRIRVDVAPPASGGQAGASGQGNSGQQQGGAGRDDLQRGFSHDAGEGRSRGFADDRSGARDGERQGWRDDARPEAGAAPVFERWLRLGLDATA